jgi:hypothetical protein
VPTTPTTDYITKEELKASLELTGSGWYDGDIPRVIAAASRAVDGYCNRRFYYDTADTVRYYRLRQSVLALEDLGHVTAIAASTVPGQYTQTGTEGTDYVLEPLNAAADGRPYTLLRAIGWWPTYRWCPPAQLSVLRITGKYGWAEIPSQVPMATSILASKLLVRQRQAPFGIVTAGGEVGVAMRIAANDPDVVGLLEDLVRDPMVI